MLNSDGTEGSTRRQEQAVHAHLKANDMGRVVAVYSDIASAYKEGAKRPDFENALLDLRAGRIDGIAVWKIDRLVRRTNQYRRVLDILEESGGRLFSLVEGIDTAAEGASRAITNIVLSILVSLAEMESENTSDRVLLMQQERARMGLVQRSSCRPFGHTDDWSEVVLEEAALIREAAERVLKGEGIRTIARDWDRRGIKTLKGNPWHHATIRGVLASARLVGKREYGGAVFDYGDVPPILDEDTWARVRDVLENRVAPNPAGPKGQRLLTGIVLCGRCDAPLVGNVNKYGKQTYQCRKRGSQPNACGGVQVLAERVDERVGQEVVGWLSDRRNVTSLMRQHAKGAELEALHARQQELNESLLVLAQALNPPAGKPRMHIDVYWAEVDRIEAEREQLSRRLAVTREAALLAETLSEEWAPETWASKPVEWKRAIISLVTERIEVSPELRGPVGSGVFGNRFDPERVKIKFAA